MYSHRKLYNLFYLFFCFFSFVLTAGTVEKEVAFQIDDLTFSELDGYDLVKLNGCKSTVEIGAPLLPRASFSLLIPQGAKITNIEVISADKEEISGEYNIYPTQHPQPFLKDKVYPFVEPDEYIYSENTAYPEEIIEFSHTGSMSGYKLAGLLVYPIQYIPSEKKLIFHSKIKFKVTYEDNLRSLSAKTEKQNKIFKERVKNLILNPEDIDILEPSIGLSGAFALPADTIEYVIITVDSFASAFQELADWKTKKGVPAKVITLDSIYANYTGADNAEMVRNFIIDANSTWGTIWVLLGGQCDYEWGQEIVPRRNVWYRTVDGDETDTIPSDLYFSDLDGNWNADGDDVYGESTDDVDLYSDVFVGRAPVRTAAQAEIFVNKVLTYEKSPPSGYQKKILLPAAILWSYYDEKLSQEAIANMVPGDWQVSKLYERDGNLTHEAFVDSVKSGFGFAHLVGHGNQYGIYTYYADAYFNSDDLDALDNDGLLGIHNSIGCMCGALDYVPYGDCFAEHYLTPSTGGGYSIMNSRYGWGNPPSMGPSEHIDTCFYHEIFRENYTYHDHVGVAHAFSKDGYIPEVTWGAVWAWCIYELNLFGDPEMPLWTDDPGELTVTHDAVIPVGGSSFSVNVSDGGFGVEEALVCLYKEDEVYARGYTDASGNITLTLSSPPNSLGILYCTVTKNNYIPYEGTIDVISPSGPWVIFENYTVIDGSGNSDDNVDPGESIELPLTVHNVGLGDAFGVTGIIRTEDPYVTLIDSIENFGDILADSLSISLEDFDFDVSSGCAANHVINFELIVSDVNDSTWNSYFSVPISTPDIALVSDTLDFDTVYIGHPDTLDLLVNNVGTDTLRVINITSDNIDYSVNMANFNVPPGKNHAVGVIFSPVSETPSTGNLTLECNDLDEPSLTIFLQGEGLLPPDISVSPDSLSDSLFTGETSTHTLVIRNDGSSDLNFNILIEEFDTSSTFVNFFADKSVRNHKVVAFGKPVPLEELKNGAFPLLPQSTEVTDDFIDKDKPFASSNFNATAQSLAIGEEVFGNDDNEYFNGPRTRGNIFSCTESSTLIEHRLYLNPSASTQLYFLVYEGESQSGTYNLISASDVTPAGSGLGWYSSGDVDVPLEEGKYYLIVASFEELSNYYNQQGISTYPIPASFGELIAGAGWSWAPTTVFPPAPAQDVPSYAFGDPVAYYQTLVTGRWIYSDSSSGTLSAGDSMLIEVTFDAAGLNGGDYFADIIITSNDPDESEVIVPAHLHVTGVPDIAISEDTLDYGIVFTGYSSTDTFIVTNDGTDLLTVSDISSDNSDYTVEPTNFTVNPGEEQEVAVTLTPSSLGTITGNLTITSDDPDEPSLNIFLQGEGLEPPDISVSPDSLSDSLFTGEMSIDTLMIYNTGGSDLNFNISIEESEDSPIRGIKIKSSKFFGNDIDKKSTFNLSAVQSNNKYSSGHPASRERINPGEIKLGRKMATDLKILLLEGGGEVSEMQSLLLGFPDISVVDIFHAYSATPSLDTLLSYDCVIVTNDNPFYNPTQIGDVLADYVDAGGGLIITVASFASGWEIQGRLLDEGYMPFNIGSGPIGIHSLGDFNSSHPIMEGVTEAWGDLLIDMTIASGAELVAEWDNDSTGTGLPFIATKGSDVAGVNIFFANPGYWTGDVPLILHNAAFWTGGGVTWMYCDTNSGTTPAGDSTLIEVTFDATGLYGGDYFADIIVSSNDPDESEVVVPAHLHVTGAPDIAVSDDSLDYGIVFTGYSSCDTLIITNVGTDSLTVDDISSDNSDFSADITSFCLDPEETQEVVVTFTPSTLGTITGNLTISSDDPDDPSLTVFMEGECVEPPIITINPHHIGDTLFTGDSATHILNIGNLGSGDLFFEISEEKSDSVISQKKIPYMSAHFENKSSSPNISQNLYSTKAIKEFPEVLTYNQRNQITGDPKPLAGTYTGDHLSFGLTDYGEIMPFQYPVGVEHLQIGSYYSGYTVCYNDGTDHVAYAGYGTRSGITPVSYSEVSNTVDEAIIDVVTQTNGGELTITQRFTFNKHDKFIRVLANIENTSGTPINNVAFKSWADWDMDGDFGDDEWDYDSSYSMIYAWDTHYGTIAGERTPDYRDIDGWDDFNRRTTDEDITEGPLTNYDGLEILHFEMGNFSPGEENSISYTYASADDLSELEEIVERSLENVRWLSENPDTGIVTSGNSMEIEIKFNAKGMYGGNYHANLIVASNDPATPTDTVSCFMHVVGVPDIALSSDSLDFGTVYSGSSSSRTLTISNEGTDSLTVSNISSNNSRFTVDITNFTLNPGESQEVTVTFTPSSEGIITGNLNISSDDPDEPSLSVFLRGECTDIEIPHISVSPTSLSDSLFTDEISFDTLTIYNTGSSYLSFNISIEETAGLSINKIKEKTKTIRIPGTRVKTISTLQTLTLTAKPNKKPQKGYDSSRSASRGKIDPGEIKLGNKMATNVKILLIESKGDVSEMQSLLMSFPDISVVDIFDAYSTTPSPDTLLAYDCVILANNNPFDNPTAMGNVLADYVDAGGGLVLTAPSFVSGYAVEGRLLDEGYMPFDIGSGPIGPLNLGNFNASHPVMKEVSSALGDALANTNIAPEAELIAEWNTDSTGRIPFIAIKDFVAGANIYFGNSGFWTGDIPIILHNVILSSIMRAVPWMHCNPTSGTIAPDDMEFIVITFDATGLESDDYYANMIITSNDPERPVVYVPSHLHVSGVPDIVISADSLDQGIVYPGFCSVDTLTVSNEGTDLLTVSNISSDNSDFTIDTTNFTLNPGETQDIVITFTPSSMGLITGNLLIESNDPDEAALTVFLKGECVEPPVISVQPGSLSDTLTSDQSSKKIIRIYNAGASDLIFNIATGEMLSGEINKSIAGKISLSSQSIEYLEVRKDEEDPRKGNPVVLGAGGPDSSGYNWIDSDEGSDCQFDWIDITSTGTQVTGLSDDNFVGPYPISFEFPFYDSVYTEFYIASNGFIGFGPTSGYSNFSNQPIPTSNTPNNIIAWCWDDLNQNGSVYYQDFGDRLVVQFVDYGEYGASGRINAEVTIYRSGKIIIQYLNSHDGFDLLSNTIGIENISGNDGLQVAFNTDYIHDSLAVEFSIGPSWLSINPLTDTVSSGDSVMLAVNFDAAGLEVGDYYSDIIINNNDPLEPKLIVPAHLYVVGSGVEEKGIPKKFFISQNTPNPFNRQTVIKYGCPRRSHVCIQLFDVMGRVANTLIDKEVEAGYHEIKWDGNNKLGRKLPNAVYFYRMRVDKENFMEIKKMILLQ